MRLLFLSLLLFTSVVFCQEQKTEIINFNHIPAAQAINLLQKKFHVKISFADSYLADKTVSIKRQKLTLKETLYQLSDILGIKFKFVSEKYIVINLLKKPESKNVQLNEIVLNSYLTKGISKNKNGTYRIKPKELDILPGLTEADVLESILELPGVISPNETATDLNVRGGTPDQNQITWDGITIYHTGHLFGMISPFNPNIIKNVTFYNKGTNPRFGDRISSVIDIRTSNEVVKKFHGGFGFNAISADVNLEIPIIKDKLSILTSFRRSYEDFYETKTFKKLEEKVFQSTSILDNLISKEKFFFKDYNFKLNYKLNEKNSMSISTIHIDNDLDHIFSDKIETNSYRDKLDTENDGYSFDWRKIWNDKISQKTKISHSRYQLSYHFITKQNGGQPSDFDKENLIKETNFSTEFIIDTKKNNTFNVGYQYSLKNAIYSYTEVKDLSYLLDKDNSTVKSYSIFGNYSNKNFNLFNFDIGLRSTYYSKLKAFRLEPRVLISKHITPSLRLQVTGEMRNQIIGQIEETVLSQLSLEKTLWKLSNGIITPIIHSNQISTGLVYSKNKWSFDIDTYMKNTSGITALSLGFLDNTDRRFHNGIQKIYGTNLYIKKDFKNIKAWVSYSFTDIKNKYDGINDNKYFTANNEIRHAFSTSIAYKTKKFQISLGWKWHSGKPYTKSYINANNKIAFNEINTGNLPSYHRLDLSSVYNFSFGKNTRLKGKLGFSIRNIYNQNNLISREYTGNNIPNDPILITDKYSIKQVPNFLFRINW